MKKSFNFIKKHVFMFLFLAFLLLMFANYVFIIVSNGTEVLTSYKIGTNKRIEYIDKYYELSAKTKNQGASSLLKEFESKWRELTNLATTVSSFVVSDAFLNGNALFCRSIGMKYIPGTTFVKLDGGMLTYIVNDDNIIQKKQSIDKELRYLNAFSELLKQQGIDITYFNAPNKKYALMSSCPVGLRPNEYFDLNEYVHNQLDTSYGIPCVDIMMDENADTKDFFYTTDHHWKTEHGIYAAKKISTYLNEAYNYGIDTTIYDKENYHQVVCEGALLGSIGTNSTKSFTDAENMTIYYPIEDSNYTFLIPSKSINMKGGFDIFINHTKLNDKSQWPFNAYASYIYANSAYVSIKNTQIQDKHRVLVIKDSFANVVVPYLAQSIGQIDVLDIRDDQSDYFSDSVLKLIRENQYDNILFIANEPFDMKLLFVKE